MTYVFDINDGQKLFFKEKKDRFLIDSIYIYHTFRDGMKKFVKNQ